MRELVLQCQQWASDTPRFLHSIAIYTEAGRHFIAQVDERYGPRNPIDTSKIMGLRGKEFFIDQIWPAYDGSLTRSHGNPHLFLKRPSLMDVALRDPEAVKRGILSEARVGEELRRRPHPNIVDYQGCLVEDGKVKGIWLKHYREILTERVQRAHDREKILAQVEAGVEHLHSLGIVHGDLHPGNIMFDDHDDAVIVDFDSAHTTGDLLVDGDKHGSKFFSKAAECAVPENDHYSIAQIKAWFEGL